MAARAASGVVWVVLLLIALASGSCASVVHVNCQNSAACDSAVVAAAVLNSTSGDHIAFHGVCVVTETVVLRGDRTYTGDSRTGTVIRQAPGANLDAVLASDSFVGNSTWTGAPVRLAHLTVDGSSATNNGTSNIVIRSWMTVVEDVLVVNAPVDGIRLTNLARDGTTALKTTQVNGVIQNCFVERSGQHGVHVLDTGNSVTDWSLLNSWIASSNRSAIYFDNAAGWQVKGVHIYGVGEHAIFANRCFATTLADNYIEGFGRRGGDGSDTWYGIACTVQSGAASVISGNKVFQLAGAAPPAGGANFVYIGVPRVHAGCGVLSVANNVLRGWNGPTDTGLLYQSGGAGCTLEVGSSGNVVVSAGTPRVVGKGVTIVQPL